jgi:hypothetical protein
MATATTTRTRKPRPKPADTCRLTVTIRGESYTARPNPNAPGLAWRLQKASGGATYDVSHTSCDCPDSTYRHAGGETECKHRRSLRALGLLPAADAAAEDDPSDPDNGDPATWPEWTDRHAYRPTRRR